MEGKGVQTWRKKQLRLNEELKITGIGARTEIRRSDAIDQHVAANRFAAAEDFRREVESRK